MEDFNTLLDNAELALHLHLQYASLGNASEADYYLKYFDNFMSKLKAV